MNRVLKVLLVSMAFAVGAVFAQPADERSEVCPCDDMWALAIAWSNCAVRVELETGLHPTSIYSAFVVISLILIFKTDPSAARLAETCTI